MEEIKITKVNPKDPKTMIPGEWFFIVGWGFCLMAERGFVVMDTKPELEEEFNLIERK
jgi:hypothetical protein